MSALADALVAAQRRALTALEKQYVAGNLAHDSFVMHLNELGLSDGVDQARLVYALDLIGNYGAALPSEPAAQPAEKPKAEKATAAQLGLVGRLFSEKRIEKLPDAELNALSKADAHKLIDQLKTDTYNESEWTIPF